MFKGKTRINKEEGHEEIESLPTIEPEDMEKLGSYFDKVMQGPPRSSNSARNHILYGKARP